MLKNIELCVPICCDIKTLDINYLIDQQLRISEIIIGKPRRFDVIMIDPPWNLTTSNDKTEIMQNYNTLKNEEIKLILRLKTLQTSGFLFVWVINDSFDFTVNWISDMNYTVVDRIDWIKISKKGNMKKSKGSILMHSKETCLICLKHLPEQRDPEEFFYSREELLGKLKNNRNKRVILGPSEIINKKPDRIYEFIEDMFENKNDEDHNKKIKAFYLEIFGRRHNLRNKWVTIGNQI